MGDGRSSHSLCQTSLNLEGLWSLRCLVSIYTFLFTHLHIDYREFHDTKDKTHLINAGKYSTKLVVASISVLCSLYPKHSPLFYCFIGGLFVNAAYFFVWDLTMDWGLFNSHKFPRESRLYSKSFYYFAVVENFVLRFSLALLLHFHFHLPNSHEVIVTVLSSLEVIRRSIWNLFRWKLFAFTACYL